MDGKRNTDIFQPILHIGYSERINVVRVTAAGMDGRYDFTHTVEMRHSKLPLFLFQLVDRGYRLAPDVEEHDGFKIVYAFSREYTKLMEIIQAAQP